MQHERISGPLDSETGSGGSESEVAKDGGHLMAHPYALSIGRGGSEQLGYGSYLSGDDTSSGLRTGMGQER